MYLAAKKKLDNWILWIIVNTFCIVMYFRQDLFLYAVLYGAFMTMAVSGYYKWKAELPSRHTHWIGDPA